MQDKTYPYKTYTYRTSYQKAVHHQTLLKALYTAFFLLLTALILTNSQESLLFALNGLNLWFEKMIPSLLPFMILSGIMVRMHLTESFASLLHPLLAPFWKIRKNVTYAIIMGFLCGFPMGARVVCDLLKRDMITENEAEFLLSFCNNIGPVYFCSFVIPLLHRRLLLPYLFGMYGLPFLYGLFLRHTAYSHKISPEAHAPKIPKRRAPKTGAPTRKEPKTTDRGESRVAILEQIDDAILSGIQSILMLGGYMILFNLFNLIPYALKTWFRRLPWPSEFSFPLFKGAILNAGQLAEKMPLFIAPVLEITGGLGMLKDSAPLLALLLLPFGGLSCIAQTYSMIKHTDLSISHYVCHKLILTGLTLLYYICWAVFFPQTFLK